MNVKFSKLAVALAVSALSVSSFAADLLTFSGGTATSKVAFDVIDTTGYFSNNTLDTTKYDVNQSLVLNDYSDVTFTFLGKEAGYTNSLWSFNVFDYTNAVVVGSSVTFHNVATGLLNFGFKSNNVGAINYNPSSSIGLMRNADGNSAIALFNDRFNDIDYDDMGVKISVTAVPEPESYALMLAGLGLMGTIARRRNKAKAA